jgi:hypothetical protein
LIACFCFWFCVFLLFQNSRLFFWFCVCFSSNSGLFFFALVFGFFWNLRSRDFRHFTMLQPSFNSLAGSLQPFDPKLKMDAVCFNKIESHGLQ